MSCKRFLIVYSVVKISDLCKKSIMEQILANQFFSTITGFFSKFILGNF